MNNTELVKSFREDGYIYLPAFLNADELDALQEEVARIKREVAPAMPREEVYYEDKGDTSTLKQLQRLFQYDEYSKQLVFGSRFEQLAETLLENSVIGINLQYFNKPPGVGKPTPPHQDGFYFMLEPNEALTMWLALDEADEQNGCVHYVRGSNAWGMRPHVPTGTLGFSQGIADFGTEQDKQHTVGFPASPGDLLVHHALTVHWAGGNHTLDRQRQSLGFIYYSADAEEHPDKPKRQADLVTQLKEQGKI